ncbi:hypothetical protein ACM64Y_01810 [Novispirillum sp. DQ9]|uniref:hypothetical protein n=1 Tax=Novispirillum sp. DQ9 TaxID=3398612 RepID=UPI003C7986CB
MADRFENIEDAQAGAWDMDREVLTDDQLEAGGLVEVRAWVRTKASGNALRQQRKRDKMAEEGRAQVNVVVPEECKEPLKELAAALAAGQIDADQVRAMIADAVAELDAERDQVQQQAAAAQSELDSLRAELERTKAEAVAILEKSQAQAADYEERLKMAGADLRQLRDAKAAAEKRHAEEATGARGRILELEAEVKSHIDLNGRAEARHRRRAEELAEAIAALTAAEAERDRLRAALDAHTLRGRLARWLVGRV